MDKIESSHEKQKLENLKRVLSSDKINDSAISRLAGETVNNNLLQDFKRNKGLLHPDQVLALKTAINTIRIKLKALLNEFDNNPKSEAAIKQFKELLKRKEIVWFVVFDRDRTFYRKIQGWELGRRSFPIDNLAQLKSFILIFLTETTI